MSASQSSVPSQQSGTRYLASNPLFPVVAMQTVEHQARAKRASYQISFDEDVATLESYRNLFYASDDEKIQEQALSDFLTKLVPSLL
jgi:hypothetical protein